MSKGLEVNVEMGLCSKEMAKENPIKDFEILIEEHKEKWSKQMYDYFKECLNEIKKNKQALEIIKSKEMLSVFKDIISGQYFIIFNDIAIEIPQEEYDLLKEVLK